MPIYLDDTLTPEELELIQAVMPYEEFRKTAIQDYGAEWEQHVPTAINALIMRYFKKALFPWQLAFYYCPVPEATILGGRGAGKTTMADAIAMYVALHPGEDHLHIAPTKDQAILAYHTIMGDGAPDGILPRFVERFVESAITAPFPEIRLHRWNKRDPGSVIRFRSLGDENIERLRSHEAGSITVDEAFRTVESDATYGQLRGCIRGTNRFMLNHLSPDEQQEITMRINALTLLDDPFKKKREEAEVQAYLKEKGLNKRGFFCLYGNAGAAEWIWQRYDKWVEAPEKYWSITVTSYDNPYFGADNLKALEEQFADDPDAREVEMEAGRPKNLGDVFAGHLIEKCTNRDLLPIAVKAAHEKVQGYRVERAAHCGIYLYQVPPIEGHWHVIAADPGSGLAPGRNKWTIGVFDV
jgi:hypothetical protein